MKKFIESGACRSGVHCQTCRAKEEGRGFRIGLGNAFVLPNDAPDFACPHGKGWGWRKPSSGLGDTVGKILKAMGLRECRKCKKRKKALNKLVPYKVEGESNA